MLCKHLFPKSYRPADDIVYPYPGYTGAQGGRVGRQEGGIMDLGGAEKDYRNTGTIPATIGF